MWIHTGPGAQVQSVVRLAGRSGLHARSVGRRGKVKAGRQAKEWQVPKEAKVQISGLEMDVQWQQLS